MYVTSTTFHGSLKDMSITIPVNAECTFWLIFFFADFVCPTILSVFVTENISILSCILIKIIILDTVFLDLMSLLSVNGVLNNAQVKGDRTQK